MVKVIDGYFPADLVAEASATWPQPDWAHWLRYDTLQQRKRTCNFWDVMPPACAKLLALMLMHDPPSLMGLPEEELGLLGDGSLYGAGMHSMGYGDFLGMHLDADRHPRFGLQRRFNAILFLESWRLEWAGELEFRDGTSVRPAANRFVLFETTDHRFHGVPRPLTCPADRQRKSLAVYWWGEPSGESKRPKAEFVSVPVSLLQST